MPSFPIGDSTRRLITAVKKLETTLNTVGLPRFVARLPVCWLCWHYCRTLDQKIVRMRRIANKFEQWLPTIRDFGREGPAQLELIDIDRSMHTDIEVTKARCGSCAAIASTSGGCSTSSAISRHA